jgi:hypothetical protein
LPFVNYIYKKNHHPTPKQVVNVFDLGHPGVEKHYEKQISLLPYKKKKDQESSAGEKECNKSHSKKIITIECTISRLKNKRILAEVFRNKSRNIGILAVLHCLPSF